MEFSQEEKRVVKRVGGWYGGRCGPDMTHMCAARGLIHSLKFMTELDRLPSSATIAYAASHGRLGTIQWLRLNGCHWNTMAPQWAAKERHRKVVRWLIMNGCPWVNSPEMQALLKEDFDLSKWLRDNGLTMKPVEEYRYGGY